MKGDRLPLVGRTRLKRGDQVAVRGTIVVADDDYVRFYLALSPGEIVTVHRGSAILDENVRIWPEEEA